MDILEKIISHLDYNEIVYEILDHLPSRTSIESATARGDSTEFGAKALVLKVDKVFMLFVLRAYAKIDVSKLGSLFLVKEKKIRFATVEELMSLTGLEPGAIPPFGKPILELPLYIDQSIYNGIDFVSFNAGSHTTSIRMAKKDYLNSAIGSAADFSKSTGTKQVVQLGKGVE